MTPVTISATIIDANLGLLVLLKSSTLAAYPLWRDLHQIRPNLPFPIRLKALLDDKRVWLLLPLLTKIIFTPTSGGSPEGFPNTRLRTTGYPPRSSSWSNSSLTACGCHNAVFRLHDHIADPSCHTIFSLILGRNLSSPVSIIISVNSRPPINFAVRPLTFNAYSLVPSLPLMEIKMLFDPIVIC